MRIINLVSWSPLPVIFFFFFFDELISSALYEHVECSQVLINQAPLPNDFAPWAHIRVNTVPYSSGRSDHLNVHFLQSIYLFSQKYIVLPSRLFVICVYRPSNEFLGAVTWCIQQIHKASVFQRETVNCESSWYRDANVDTSVKYI